MFILYLLFVRNGNTRLWYYLKTIFREPFPLLHYFRSLYTFLLHYFSIFSSLCQCLYKNTKIFFLQSLGKKQEKRPKTIHRCILQKMTSLDSNSLARRINCHVCGEAYATYKCYLDHLLDKSCERTQNRRQQHTVSSLKKKLKIG